jgi:hypothetical protein
MSSVGVARAAGGFSGPLSSGRRLCWEPVSKSVVGIGVI